MKDQEIADLRATIEEQSQEYADILEVKIKLDNEIATYRKLLETEEERYKLLKSDWMNLDCSFYEVWIVLILIYLLLFFWLMYFKREKY